jgi:ABC-2 type transport system ATP-binding protein
MDEAEALADKVVIIDHGAVVAQGSVSELTSTADPVISVRCASGIDLDALADRLDDPRVTVSAVRPGRFTVTAPVSPDLITALTDAVAAQDVLITSLSVEQRSLESVFLDITGREIRA